MEKEQYHREINKKGAPLPFLNILISLSKMNNRLVILKEHIYISWKSGLLDRLSLKLDTSLSEEKIAKC